jgi:hypothetical protein
MQRPRSTSAAPVPSTGTFHPELVPGIGTTTVLDHRRALMLLR